MQDDPKVFGSGNDLRRHISALNLARCETTTHELTYGRTVSVIYGETETGEHGNFLRASYKRIVASAAWRKRLAKTYTASARVPRSWERRRGELECAGSSDALLMNIFCYPRLLHSARVCALLNIESGLRPDFGVRAYIPMHNDETDRTELDMVLGSLQVEAKLTESGFGTASRQRLLRYLHVEEVFDLEDLPWNGDKVGGYQLIRGVLSAHAMGQRYLLLCDARRADLHEAWFRVLRAIRSYDLRSRMGFLSWQELASQTPLPLQTFLREKYGCKS